MKENKIIAIFISSFRAGGGEKVMIEIANNLSKKKFKVYLLVLNPVGDYKDHLEDRVNVISLYSGRMIFSLPKLIFFLRNTKPDYLLALDEYTHLLSIIAKLISRSKTFIYLRLGNIFSILHKRHWDNKKFFIVILSKFLYRYSDKIITNSIGVANDAKKVFKLLDKNIVIIGNPKPVDFILEKSKEKIDIDNYFFKSDIPTIVSVGRIRKQKGFDTLIRAVSEVNKVRKIELIIVGQGRDKEELGNLVKSLNLEDKIKFVGYQDNPYSFISQADLFVMSSLWEGLPNALLEAMICRVPVISSDCLAGPREIIAPQTDIDNRLTRGYEIHDNGVLFAVGDYLALSQAIMFLLDRPQLLKNMTLKGFDRVKDFDTDKILDQYIKLFS